MDFVSKSKTALITARKDVLWSITGFGIQKRVVTEVVDMRMHCGDVTIYTITLTRDY